MSGSECMANVMHDNPNYLREIYSVGPLSMNQNNTQMKTQIFCQWDNFNGWCKHYLIAKYRSYTAYARAY